MEPREKALIERVLAGDTAAFEPLVLPYRRPMLSLAYRIVRDAEDAKEIAQEALLRAFKYLRRCDLERGFRNWLLQILVNAARDHRRKRALEASWRSAGSPPELSPDPGAGPDEAHARRTLRAEILSCLDGLSAKEREVFLLRDVEQLNVEETARVLGLSRISVRVHLSRARPKIKARMEKIRPHLFEGRS
ncbi:MAG: RNA polymerase sigma factor [Candidatus Aminicenantes bacterium]|nr:RNA polymerase sigma factor [Candidatus Aminicenantes bacterium]